MRLELAKCWFKYLGVWLALAAVVTLLTLLFNFLGTLSSAAVAGMMLGAIKHRRVTALATSLVFPGIVFALMCLSRIELDEQKQRAVLLLSFGCFWMTYLLTSLLMGMEARGQASDSAADRTTTPEPNGPDREVATAEIAATATNGKLRLQQLQGRWSCECATANGRVKTKVIEITKDRLILNGFDARGRPCLHVESLVRCENNGASEELVLAAPGSPYRSNPIQS